MSPEAGERRPNVDDMNDAPTPDPTDGSAPDSGENPVPDETMPIAQGEPVASADPTMVPPSGAMPPVAVPPADSMADTGSMPPVAAEERPLGIDLPDASELRPTRPGTVAAMTAVGVALLSAATVISATRSRAHGDLDWSNYVIGLGSSAILLIVAFVAAALVRRKDNPLGREELVTWPGVFGILGAAVMTVIGLEEQSWFDDIGGYLLGGAIAAAGLIGYAAARRAAFVVVTILGLGIAYVQLSSDVLTDIDTDDGFWVAAAALTVFVVAVTVIGWVLPTRATAGAATAWIGVVGFAGLLGGLAATRAFEAAFSFGEEPQPRSTDADNDIWIMLGLAAALVVFWALAAGLTGHAGFTLAAIAMAAITVPAAVYLLAVESPTWWGVAVGGAGGVLLAGGGLLGRAKAKSVATSLS